LSLVDVEVPDHRDRILTVNGQRGKVVPSFTTDILRILAAVYFDKEPSQLSPGKEMAATIVRVATVS